MTERVLFVDDDPSGRELGRYNLSEAGYEVDLAEDGQQAMELFGDGEHALVITDMRMPGLSGMELLEQIKERVPDVPVVVITAHGNVEIAVQAMKAGAYDFIEKPFSRDVLLLVVRRALEHRRLKLENRVLRRKARGVEREIAYASEAMERLLQTVDRVAKSDAAVLISGESGTGKELIARRLHARSPRGDGPFVPVNCAALPSSLLESELFGHRRGAFTGAVTSRLGRFRQARGGTVLLDEVGEIPLDMQGKLLRVLQEKTVDVVGQDRPEAVDVRVLAATNRSLSDRIQQDLFRQDLYYRLNVVELQVLALRERRSDIAPLARHFVALASGARELELPEEVLQRLQQHDWPGNVRELENTCERMVLLCEGDKLCEEDLPHAIHAGSTAGITRDESWPPLPPNGFSLVDLERRVVERALDLQQGNITRAASYLQVPRHVLAYRIKKFGISRG